MELIYTNDLCTGCNKCVRSCPVLTANIATQEGYVTVDTDKCIVCGQCFDVCPHEARDYYDDTVNVKWEQGETPDLEAVAAEIKKNL